MTTERVFKKRGETHQDKNWNIAILIDSSGSMDGSRRENAKQATHAIAEVLSQIKFIDFEIAEFGNTDLILKPYGRRYTGKELKHYSLQGASQQNDYYFYSNGTDLIDAPRKDLNMAGYKMIGAGGYGGTNDSIAIFRASRRLEKRSGNKILIVITDGGPTGDYTFIHHAKTHSSVRGSMQERKVIMASQDPHQALHQIITQIKKEKQIIMLGVGVQATQVEEYYPQHVIINSLPQFFSKLSGLLAKQIKKI